MFVVIGLNHSKFIMKQKKVPATMFIMLFVAILLFISCSVSNKISRTYNGVGRDVLLTDFGEPLRIVQLKNGNELYVFVKETVIRQTEIGTGRFTLDPRMSPSFVKEEVYSFELDSNGVVVQSMYEKNEK
jgi:hypothetical protein